MAYEVNLGSIMGPRWLLPNLFFDIETSSLYRGPESTGYEFLVVDSVLYYREKQ